MYKKIQDAILKGDYLTAAQLCQQGLDTPASPPTALPALMPEHLVYELECRVLDGNLDERIWHLIQDPDKFVVRRLHGTEVELVFVGALGLGEVVRQPYEFGDGGPWAEQGAADFLRLAVGDDLCQASRGREHRQGGEPEPLDIARERPDGGPGADGRQAAEPGCE